ncbi:MAG: hypothetical protein QM831_34580 [Kofleriaceae bacterium]
MPFRALFVAALLSTIAYADTKPPTAPAKITPPTKAVEPNAPSQADINRWVAFYDKLVDLVVADQNNCVQMATDINAHIDANQQLVADAKKWKTSGHDLPKDVKDKLQKNVTDVMTPAMRKCGSDKSVIAAMERLK